MFFNKIINAIYGAILFTLSLFLALVFVFEVLMKHKLVIVFV